jgi:hypothetical protein
LERSGPIACSTTTYRKYLFDRAHVRACADKPIYAAQV